MDPDDRRQRGAQAWCPLRDEPVVHPRCLLRDVRPRLPLGVAPRHRALAVRPLRDVHPWDWRRHPASGADAALTSLGGLLGGLRLRGFAVRLRGCLGEGRTRLL